MTKPNSTAYPRNADHTDWGLTKREYFAAMAMQAITTGIFSLSAERYRDQLKSWIEDYGEDAKVKESIALSACVVADALIEQLNKGAV